MQHYNVNITARALNDMEEIYNYIANVLQEPSYALNQYNRIADSIEKLSLFPQRIAVMKSAAESAIGLRRLLVDNYSIFYLIQNENVIVTNVLYSASNIEARLEES